MHARMVKQTKSVQFTVTQEVIKKKKKKKIKKNVSERSGSPGLRAMPIMIRIDRAPDCHHHALPVKIKTWH